MLNLEGFIGEREVISFRRLESKAFIIMNKPNGKQKIGFIYFSPLLFLFIVILH